ncbi:DUF1775 domain-containing protein [Dactylosporangium sp. NPDC051541]|uniref:DUF1775 domain-containing protein n=1 Tax=Dactylosporangium sp. NPDC051541 TaxID=3363977 RepID=UPI0037AF973E
MLAATVAGLVLTALPAAAHVAVKADKAQAGAADVTISFSAEGESSKAGIASVKVALPAGIAPADVSYVSGPAGWTLAADADGYTVSGPALAAKKSADYAVKVAKLPADAAELTFKTLVNYTDGKVDRWIDAPGTDSPAPVLKLAAAAPVATTAAPSAPATSAAAPSTQAAVTTPITDPTDAAADDTDSSATPWIALAVVVVVALAAVLFFRYRRRNSETS